jgi:hypothetical protein
VSSFCALFYLLPPHFPPPSCIDQKFGVTNMAIQTAGSSNPNAGAEGQLAGLKNATAFRDRLLAARDALTGNTGAAAAASPLALGSMQYVTVPSAAHSMQHGSASLELQQLQEINAGIKQASRPHRFLLDFCFFAPPVSSRARSAC